MVCQTPQMPLCTRSLSFLVSSQLMGSATLFKIKFSVLGLRRSRSAGFVRKFLGLANFFRRFVAQHTDTAARCIDDLAAAVALG
jgi:hypothetical protein